MRRFIIITIGIIVFAIADTAQAFTLRVACYGGVFTKVQAKYAGALFTSQTALRSSGNSKTFHWLFHCEPEKGSSKRQRS